MNAGCCMDAGFYIGKLPSKRRVIPWKTRRCGDEEGVEQAKSARLLDDREHERSGNLLMVACKGGARAIQAGRFEERGE